MGCPTTTVKVSYIVFNVILTFFGVGAIFWITYNQDVLTENASIAAYIASALIVLFSFLGCYAAIRESVLLTSVCAVFLLLLAILQIFATITNVANLENRNPSAEVEKQWQLSSLDNLQERFECCGKVSPNDYILLNQEIPSSCYREHNKNDLSNLYKEGCSEKLKESYEDQTFRFMIVSWILIAIELLGFILSVFLAISFRNKQRRLQF